jgi:hypothetical protein
MNFSRKSYLEDGRQNGDNIWSPASKHHQVRTSVPKEIHLQAGQILLIFDKTGPKCTMSGVKKRKKKKVNKNIHHRV